MQLKACIDTSLLKVIRLCSFLQVSLKQIVVGVCAMAKKTQSKPMHEILTRLELFEFLTVNVFDEETIVKKPVSEWPRCDCLISFQSSGKLPALGQSDFFVDLF